MAGVLLTVIVEYVQAATGIGTAQVADILHNSVSAVLGATGGSLLRGAIDRRRSSIPGTKN